MYSKAIILRKVMVGIFRAREEGQRETDSLRVYVGSVEAAAAGLLSRVQELEHLLALC